MRRSLRSELGARGTALASGLDTLAERGAASGARLDGGARGVVPPVDGATSPAVVSAGTARRAGIVTNTVALASGRASAAAPSGVGTLAGTVAGSAETVGLGAASCVWATSAEPLALVVGSGVTLTAVISWLCRGALPAGIAITIPITPTKPNAPKTHADRYVLR